MDLQNDVLCCPLCLELVELWQVTKIQVFPPNKKRIFLALFFGVKHLVNFSAINSRLAHGECGGQLM